MQRRHLLFIVLPVLLLFFLIPGSVSAYYTFANPTTAHVSIQPAARDVQNTLTLTVVTDPQDVTQNQIVGARWLTATTKQTALQAASGQGSTQAATATGEISMLVTQVNGGSGSVTLYSGSALTGFNNGITIISDQTVTVQTGATGYFRAHAASPGSHGNIPLNGWWWYGALHGSNGVEWGGSFKNSTAFTGGQDAGSYAIVQQQDINAGMQALAPTVKQSTLDALNGKMSASEKWIQTPLCTTNAISDGTVGEKVPNFHVTATATCTGEVYDTQAVQSAATEAFTTATSSQLGANYQLLGEITMTITGVQVLDKKKGTLTVSSTSAGKWVYQVTGAQKQNLVQMIRGKSVADAQKLLLQQGYIEHATVTTAHGFWIWDTLPTDVQKISITILPVS